MKTVRSILLLFVTVASISWASLTNLPDSSHYSGKSTFSGGYVEFAVYDTQSNPSEFSDYSISGSGRYIYAYQVFSKTADISYFVINGITAGAVTSSSITTVQDLNGTGVDATAEYLSVDQTKVVYEFDSGILVVGENSWLLIMRSNSDWSVGTYSLTAPNDSEIPVANGESDSTNVPEPATLGMLLIGAASMIMIRRNKLA